MLRANAKGPVNARLDMINLVVSDLDGTLLTPEHRLGDYTRKVLARLRAAGVELVLASGRHFMDLQVLASQVTNASGSEGGGCLVSCNGAAVNAGDGRLLQSTCLPPDVVEFLLHDPLFEDVQRNVFLTDAWLVERDEPSLLRYHQESGFRYEIVNFADVDRATVLKVFYYGEPEQLRALERQLLAQHGERINTTFSLPVTLEVMAAGVSKGAALARLLATRGLDAADVLCIGDGMNDLDMLQLIAEGGGQALIMDNADERLHAALPDLPRAGHNAKEAVARRLAQLLDDGQLGTG
jgi:Cof subfamily protein (haloacid dehalogenase superfamily)